VSVSFITPEKMSNLAELHSILLKIAISSVKNDLPLKLAETNHHAI